MTNTSENYRRFCVAKWLLQTKAEDEIKDKWLNLWPHIQPYLRLILISHNVKQCIEEKPNKSFLEYWKLAIRLVGFDVVTVSQTQVETATDKLQIPLKSLTELKSLIGRKSFPDRKLLALMTSIFNPNWGQEIESEFRINVGNTREFNQQYYEIYTGLLYTYNGF